MRGGGTGDCGAASCLGFVSFVEIYANRLSSLHSRGLHPHKSDKNKKSN